MKSAACAAVGVTYSLDTGRLMGVLLAGAAQRYLRGSTAFHLVYLFPPSCCLLIPIFKKHITKAELIILRTQCGSLRCAHREFISHSVVTMASPSMKGSMRSNVIR